MKIIEQTSSGVGVMTVVISWRNKGLAYPLEIKIFGPLTAEVDNFNPENEQSEE
jgi:hypothetical protein